MPRDLFDLLCRVKSTGATSLSPPPFPLSPSSPAVVDSFLQDAEMATLVKAVNMRCVEYVFEPGFSQVLVLFY